MPKPTAQVTVLVSIVTDSEKETHAYYSWTEPNTGDRIDHNSSCIIHAPVPYFTLFALDYKSSDAGWTFAEIVPKPGGTAPSYSIASNKLSLTTSIDGSAPFRFNLGFWNSETKDSFWDDPQEGNSSSPK